MTIEDSNTSTETEDLPEITDDIKQIANEGFGAGLFEPGEPHDEGSEDFDDDDHDDDFSDTSDDAVDYLDDDEDLDEEPEEDVDPLVKSMASRGVTEDQITRARSLGMSDKEIKQAGSKKALDAIHTIASRMMIDAGKNSQAKVPDKEDESDTETKSPEPKKVRDGKIHRFDLENMDQDQYEEESWKAFESHNQLVDETEALRTELDEIRSSQAKPTPVDDGNYVDLFDREADAIMPDVFGKRFDGDKDTPLEKQFIDRRSKLSDTFQELAQGYQAIGREMPSADVMLRHAAAIAFPKEMADDRSKRSTEDRKTRIKKQAARRRPAGSSQGSSRQVQHEPGSPEAIAANPNLQRFFNQLTEQ